MRSSPKLKEQLVLISKRNDL